MAGALLALLTVGVAVFDADAQELAVAEALFGRGLEDMLAGRYETGCPALEESLRLDPRPGTLFTLAECEGKRGRLATAVTRYEDYLSVYSRMTPDQQSKQRGRGELAAERKAELAPQVPRLTLVVPPDAPSDVTVKRGAVVLARPSLGIALPVDPGEHVIVTEAPGRAPVTTSFTIAAGEVKSITLEVGRPLAGGGLDRGGEPAPRLSAAAPAERVAPGDGPGGRRVAAYVAGGVGVAGLALGSVAGGLALGQKGTVEDQCNPESLVCTQEGKDAVDTGQTLGLVSTIGFGVGLSGVVLAVILLATEGDSPPPATGSGRPMFARPRVAIMPDRGAILVEGSF